MSLSQALNQFAQNLGRYHYVSYAHPLLTSIDDNNEMLGRQAVLCLLDAIAGHPHHGVERVPVKLIQRESTLPLD